MAPKLVRSIGGVHVPPPTKFDQSKLVKGIGGVMVRPPTQQKTTPGVSPFAPRVGGSIPAGARPLPAPQVTPTRIAPIPSAPVAPPPPITPPPVAPPSTQIAKPTPPQAQTFALGEGGFQTKDEIKPGYKGIFKGKENLILNNNSVNHLFTEYQGRDATAEELKFWTGARVGKLERDLSDTTFLSQPKSEEVKRQQAALGQTSIPNQAALEALSRQGVVPDPSARRGSALFAPTPQVEAAQQRIERGQQPPQPSAQIAPIETTPLARQAEALQAPAVPPPVAPPSTQVAEPTAPPAPPIPEAPVTEPEQPIAPEEGAEPVQQLQNRLVELGTPSQEEVALQQQLDTLRSSFEAGLTDIEGQPIPLRFIVGQKRELQNQATDQMNSLTRQLATFQQQRQSEINATQASLDFEQQERQFQREETAPRVVGGQIVKWNPETNKYDIVFEAPGQGAKPVTVGAGQTLVDPQTGEVIFESQTGQATKPLTVSPGQTVIDPKTGEIIFQSQDTGKETRTYQATENLADGRFRVTYDSEGNIVNKVKVGEAPEKAPTAFQSKSAGFANRLDHSGKVITEMENLGSSEIGVLTQFAPNILKSEDRQRLEQAQRNFVNALLRLESGAAIAPSEFESAKKQYFPQPGDREGTIKQKRENRQIALENMIAQAGSAYVGNDTGQVTIEEALQDPNFVNQISAPGGLQQIINDPDITEEDILTLENFFGIGIPRPKKKVSFLENFGPVTAYGSDKWRHGLDVDLQKGDNVFSPVTGTVAFSGVNGGFGNQVKIKGDDGKEYWLSHLDDISVKKGDKINANQLLGLGGNTGSVIPLGGGDGSHLDITVKDENNNFISPRNIEKLLT